MDATAEGTSSGEACKLTLGSFDLIASKGDLSARGAVKVTIRPERVVVRPQGASGANHLPGMIVRTVYLGSSIQLILSLASGANVQALVQNDGGRDLFEQGTPVSVCLPSEALRVLSPGG
jgi:ABC-type Fe3+/spermidine/putrescine transport system ATPase subunit